MDVTDTDLMQYMCNTRLKTQNMLHDKVTDMRKGGSNRGRGLWLDNNTHQVIPVLLHWLTAENSSRGAEIREVIGPEVNQSHFCWILAVHNEHFLNFNKAFGGKQWNCAIEEIMIDDDHFETHAHDSKAVLHLHINKTSLPRIILLGN